MSVQVSPRLPAPAARSELPYFTVLERESKVLGCAAMKPLGRNAAGAQVAELAAFCVHPSYRGGGKGDSLLEYLGVQRCRGWARRRCSAAGAACPGRRR